MDLKKYATESKYKTLQNLEGGDVKTQTKIAKEREVSQANTSRVIRHLEEAECVKRVNKGYQITTKGAELLYHLDQIHNK